MHASLEEGPEADGVGVSWAGPSEEDPSYRLLVECNQLAVRACIAETFPVVAVLAGSQAPGCLQPARSAGPALRKPGACVQGDP